MSFAAAERAYLTPPDVYEYGDDPGTNCLGTYPADERTDAYECDERVQCSGCGGTVCKEHDDAFDCEDGWVHTSCHTNGCLSESCAQDQRDDALLAREGM